MQIFVLGIIGVFAGISGGLFGIGGGIIIVPALVFFLGFSQKKAQGTSLVALLAPVGLLGLMNYAKADNVDFRAGAIIASTFFIGAFLGSKISVGIDEATMRKMFASLLAVVSVYMFFRK
jgi:uncharacterized protein